MTYHSPRNPVTLARETLLDRDLGNPVYVDGRWWNYKDERWSDFDLDMRLAVLEACRAARQAPKKEGDSAQPYPTTRAALGDVEECMRRMAAKQWQYGKWTDDDHWSDTDTIATVDGLYHVGTGEMRQSEYGFFEPRLVPFMPAPGPIDALEELMDGQSWGDDERQHLREVLGYILSKDTWAHKAFAFQGQPRSGKGTLARLITHCLGDLVVSSSPRGISEQFGLAPLVGKSVCLLADVRDWYTREAKSLVENVLRVSGEDDVEIRRMHSIAYSARLRARFVFVSNTIPSFDDSSGVVSSRLRIIQFRRSFLGDEDPTLGDRINAQAPAIMHWAFEGLRALRETRRWTQTAAQTEMEIAVRHASSPVSAWLDTLCEERHDAKATRAELYDSYSRFCGDNGIRLVMSKPAFYRTMRERGFTEVKVHPGDRAFRGVKLKGATSDVDLWDSPL